jgi:hypothetical protein
MLWLVFAAQLASADPAGSGHGAFKAQALDEQALARTTARGNGDQNATSTLVAGSSNNSVNGTVTTGTVTFSDSSFQGASGLTMVNSNSGNNVAINSAMTVNVSINPQQ